MLLFNHKKTDSYLAYSLLFFLGFFTASGDLFWVLSVGVTVRFSLLIFALVFFLQFLFGKCYIPKVSIYYFLWIGILGLFIFRAEPLIRGGGYWLLLLLGYLIVLSIYSAMLEFSIYKLINLYLLSFFLVALFGIFQFLLGAAGIEVMISQYWLAGLPRVNGFSYEPSYFFTYLMPAWIIIFILKVEKNDLSTFISVKKLNIYFYVISLSLLLTFSRMGILCIFVFLFTYFLRGFFKDLIGRKITLRYLKSTSILIIFSIGGIYYLSANYDVMLRGIDFNNLQESHSSGPRIKAAFEEWEAFKSNPIVGYGIGGIPKARADVRNERIENMDEARALEGSVVFLEVLVASGVVGFIFFLIFIIQPLLKIQRLKRISSLEGSIIMRSFQYAYLFTFLILQFNQNINRVYFWVLLGFIVALSSPNVIRKFGVNKNVN